MSKFRNNRSFLISAVALVFIIAVQVSQYKKTLETSPEKATHYLEELENM